MRARSTVAASTLLLAMAWLFGAETSTPLVAEQADPPASRMFLYTLTNGRLLRFDTAVIEQIYQDSPIYDDSYLGLVNWVTSPGILDGEILLNCVASAGNTQAGDLVLTPDGRYAYVTATCSDEVHVVDLSGSMSLARTIAVGDGPLGIAIDEVGHVYVANRLGRTVSVIDTASNLVARTIPLTSEPWDVAVTSDGATLFATLWTQGSYAAVDLATDQETVVDLRPPNAGFFMDSTHKGPYRIEMSPNGWHVWLTFRDHNSVAAAQASPPYGLVGGGVFWVWSPKAVALYHDPSWGSSPDASWLYIAGGPYYATYIYDYLPNVLYAWAGQDTARYSPGGNAIAVHPNGTRTYVTGTSAGTFGLGIWDNTITQPYPFTAQPPMAMVGNSYSYGLGFSLVLGPEVGSGGASGSPPEAHAGEDQVLEATAPSTPVTLDASLSTGEAPLEFSWSGTFPEGGGTVSGVSPTVTLPVGTHEITLTVTDGSAAPGTDTDSVSVTVTDDTPPLISGVDESITLEGNTPGGAVHAFSPLASDLVDGSVDVTSDEPADHFFPLGGPTIVTFSASDLLGNTATRTTSVTVVDTAAPEFTALPVDITVPSTEPGGGAVVLLDALGQVAVSDSVDSAVVITNDLPAVCGPGDTLVTFTATDGSGNSATATATVTVVDETPPVFSWWPPDVTVEATGPTTAVALGDATADDGFPGTVTITSDAPDVFPLGSTTVTFTATDAAGNSATAMTVVTVTDSTPPVITGVPAPRTVEGNALGGASLTLDLPQGTDLADPEPIVTSTAPAVFPVGSTTVTFTATDAAGNAATATTVVTVIDTTPPAMSGVPADVVVQATGPDGAIVALALPTAIDVVDGSVTVISNPALPCHCGPGLTTVVFTATDGSGNSASASTTVIVNRPPAIAMLTGNLTIVEGGTASATGTYGDPDDGLGDSVSLTASLPGLVAVGGTWSWSTPVANEPGPGAVIITATDARGGAAMLELSVLVSNAPPEVTSVDQPADPLQLEAAVTVTAHFTDPGAADTHTCSFDWDDGQAPTPGSVGETNGSESCTADRTYSEPGVYSARVTVTDDAGASATQPLEFIVVYDPTGGFITGGGWISSPAGAYSPDESLSGKATFGFVSKYKQGATVPTGQTEFQFRTADFNFHSGEYEWLVIAGPKGQFKGTGTVNGSGTYGFLLTATDGQRPGGGGVDRFRIKIWDKDAGNGVVYDNRKGSSDDMDDADPQELDKGSIVIHTKGS